ncbi:MAG: cobalamin transport operon protein [Halapricum sp.]
MKRTYQYLLTVAVLAIAFGVGYLGFVATGGAIPWGERFASIVSGGASGGDGGLFQFGRGGLGGFVLAGPLRDSVGQFLAVAGLLATGSVALYWYSKHTDESSGGNN